MKKHICLHCYEELSKDHLKEGELKFCSDDCKKDFIKNLPPGTNLHFIKRIME